LAVFGNSPALDEAAQPAVGLAFVYTIWYTLGRRLEEMIKRISIRELRPNISKVMTNIHQRFDRYIVSRRGKPEVLMMSIEDYEGWMETMEIQSDPELVKDIKQAEKEIAEGKGTSLDDLHRELGIV
jgi:antitoxin YefM